MKPFSLLFVGYVIACVTIYLAVAKMADARPESWLALVAHSLRSLYGVLLYAAGMLSLYLAGRAFQLRTSAGRGLLSIPIAILPVLIGVIATVDSYIQINQILTMSSAIPSHNELYNSRLSMLLPLFVGLGFTTVACMLIAMATLRHRGRRATDGPASVVPPA